MVYKAIHVPTLTLVAVKSIPVYDASKRHQMIKELKALYANSTSLDGAFGLRTSKGGDANAPCPHIVGFYDAFIAPNR